MVKATTTAFDDLVKLAGEFVTSRKGIWDHAAWLDFLAGVQKAGVDLSEEMQSHLGELLEATKRFYGASASVEGVDKAMMTVLRDSGAFMRKQSGIWGHAEWEAFTKQIQDNSLALTQETTAYLGGILEATRNFYPASPAPAAPSAPAAPAAPAAPETAPKKPTRKATRKATKRPVQKAEEKPGG